MSPTFISQHAGPDVERKIAHSPAFNQVQSVTTAEDVVFDKAEQAQQQASDKVAILEQIKSLEAQMPDTEKDQRKAMERRIDTLQQELAEIKSVVETPEDE